jgi:outer membrane lipoprotein-sorting protein
MKNSRPLAFGSLPLGVAVCLALLNPACQEHLGRPPDPAAMLRSISATYCGVEDYYIAGTTRITSSRGDRSTDWIQAFRSDGLFRRERMRDSVVTVLDVFDGENEWTVYPPRNEYFKSAPHGSAVDGLFEDVPGHLCALGHSQIGSVRWVSTERLPIGDRSVECDVYEVAPAQVLWFDSQNQTVVREQARYADGAQWETTYTQVHLKERQPASLFVAPNTANLTAVRAPGRGVMWRHSWAARHREATERLGAARDAEERFYPLDELAKAAFEIRKFDEARQYAREALRLAPHYRGHWSYGSAIHDGHMVLGRLALLRGDVTTARRELLEAGKTPGGPSLDTDGPNMSLAKDLLEIGEADVVREYLCECASFWKRPQILDGWIAAIDHDEVPDFGAHLRM